MIKSFVFDNKSFVGDFWFTHGAVLHEVGGGVHKLTILMVDWWVEANFAEPMQALFYHDWLLHHICADLALEFNLKVWNCSIFVWIWLNTVRFWQESTEPIWVETEPMALLEHCIELGNGLNMLIVAKNLLFIFFIWQEHPGASNPLVLIDKVVLDQLHIHHLLLRLTVKSHLSQFFIKAYFTFYLYSFFAIQIFLRDTWGFRLRILTLRTIHF